MKCCIAKEYEGGPHFDTIIRYLVHIALQIDVSFVI